jgi:class 3 adenylate cyclase/tetratricopeptide (TPR) repeat protein
MECPACSHPNRPDARFCGECGESLEEAPECPACGAANPAGQKFCDHCGERLEGGGADADSAAAVPYLPEAERPPTPEHLARKIRADAGALEGERKQVTVMFADVIGSMEHAERSDPEAWRAVMERFFAILSDGVHRFEGTVDKFTGDGIMALFGAPISHEDHARRACFAALHLQRELAAYAAELRRTEGLSLAVRMGLNSGEVVVGSIGENLGMEYTAIGHTVGLAQRMEALAEPGKAYLTEHTATLVEGYVALEDLGEFEVKGASQPLHVHELTGIGAARGRLDVSRARGFSRFVGRDEEMKVLEDALERAESGEAQVIGIVGEAGVGKSRLCHEFTERAQARGQPVYRVAAQAHTKSLPLAPVLQMMRAYFDVAELDEPQVARERIAGKLLLLDESFNDDLPLVFDFLGVSDPERPAPKMDPDARQRQLLDVIKRLIRAQSAREPGVTVFEDLHWLDPASEVFLASHVEASQGTRGVTLLNFRPEYRAPWLSKSFYRQVALAPLGPEAIEELLGYLLGSDPSLEGVAELVNERAAGNPFFTEEVVQSLVETGNLEGELGAYRLVRPIDETTVPASVQSILSARIDRLGSREKAVLQAAAVIGKEVPEPILRKVVELEREDLEEALRHLIAGEFLLEQDLFPEVIYAFKHPLTQEVAYSSQLAERRAPIHAAVAEAIAEHYPDRLDERAALIGRHWESGREPLKAAQWYARAGTWVGTSEPSSALRDWGKVRQLTDQVPDQRGSAELGLAARIFSLQYAWRLGISHEDAEATFKEAERMAAKAGDVYSRATLLAVYGGIRGTNDGDAQEAARLARQAVAIAEESGDAVVYMSLGAASYSFFRVGEYRESIRMLDRALELADGDTDVAAGVGVGCPYAYCLIFKGGALLNLGELAAARESIDRGMALAREKGDIETVGWGHMWCTWHAYLSGDAEGVLTHARQTVEIADRIGDSFSRVWSWQWLGVAEILGENWERAIEALERSDEIASERRTAIDAESWRLNFLGQAYVGAGEVEKGVHLIERALDLARATGQPPNESFAARALANALLEHAWPGEQERIEELLAKALEVTRDTDARGLEPSLHVTAARLAERLGDHERRARELQEAHRLYTEIGAVRNAEQLDAELTGTAVPQRG